MYTIGILEKGGGLSAFLAGSLPGWLEEGADLCPAASLPEGEAADLVVVAPGLGREEAEGRRLACRALLVPGRLAPLAGEFDAGWVVSYGMGAKDSLTLSSLGEETATLALQREVVTLAGTCLEEQEFTLPRGKDTPPCRLLAAAGLQLLLGVPPEEVRVEG